jgi:transposase
LRALIYLPPYSPDFNPIEEAFAKIKGLLRKAAARSKEKLVEAMGVGQSRRLERKTPAVSSSIAGTACRFNRYDERCNG